MQRKTRKYFSLLHELGHAQLTAAIQSFVDLIKTLPQKEQLAVIGIVEMILAALKDSIPPNI